MNPQELYPHIAVFDSGQGGLTVWESIVKRFPTLNVQYLGDNARCPYGNKSENTITRYTSEAALYFATRNACLMIVACGTASSVAARKLQHIYKMPIVGIVEGFCKQVNDILQNKSDTVAVLGTRFTIKSERFNEELNSYGIYNIWSRACPLFVPLVEEGISSGAMVEAAAEMYLWDIPTDTKVVMLACTHYPRIINTIAKILEKRLKRTVIYKTIDGDWILASGEKSLNDPIFILESSMSLIYYLEDFLNKNNLTNSINWKSSRSMFCTDAPAQFERTAKYFTNQILPKVEIVQFES